MRFLNCPKTESLFEFISMPGELSFARKTGLKLHLASCSGCQKKVEALNQKLKAYFQPEPDITSSLLRVYSNLQKDETLIWKGWKLGQLPQQAPSLNRWLFVDGWFFRGAVSAVAVGLLVVVIMGQFQAEKSEHLAMHSAKETSRHSNSPVPFAQIREENRNSVRVHYVQPELLQSIEFQTVGD